ncbi:large ribosomal subunit protein mL54 [Parasteatoda tepidariorum]|uniref:large ribosomal subunit protein mL54 n=1 Tax=Parasteatoda tepidariorum TaxID=114398 RepID=UPI001C71FA53|nr:39S ribosomal protein L54, mitochondrial [Parasteatoda tepidariorum]
MAMFSNLLTTNFLVPSLIQCVKNSNRFFAKTILGSLTGKSGKVLGGAFDKKKPLPVETDPQKLVNYCCGCNINKEGEDPKLLEDSEYPEWLWTLRPGPPPPLEEMDPNTKEYWERLFFLQRIRGLRLKRAKIKKKLFVNEEDKIYKLRKLRFRALAHKYSAGYDKPPKWDKDGWRIIKME